MLLFTVAFLVALVGWTVSDLTRQRNCYRERARLLADELYGKEMLHSEAIRSLHAEFREREWKVFDQALRKNGAQPVHAPAPEAKPTYRVAKPLTLLDPKVYESVKEIWVQEELEFRLQSLTWEDEAGRTALVSSLQRELSAQYDREHAQREAA